MKVEKHRKTNHFVPCPYRKQQLESNHPEKLTKPQTFGYNQACALLLAIELNRRTRLSKKCLAHLALFVSQAWEDKPCQEKIQQLYYMMNNLLDTTTMDTTEPFETSLQKFCESPVSTPTICPSVTLLIAISYVERLNKRYRDLKGTPGCGFRMIMVAFIMASKYIHDSLRLIIYTSNRNITPNMISTPITPPTSPKIPITSTTSVIQSITNALSINNTLVEKNDDPSSNMVTPASSPPLEKIAPKDNERNLRIARMEQEFLFFLNYDLSVQDPSLLVLWAQSYQVPEKSPESEQPYTSADDGDDEMDDEDN
ncbi:uncharacterized protein EV154DRAFT_516380 [Mucor mucedo]|uniref:uncharacterized protein n=1 Tax=Mucor mucedo TaxID=29922 RepID=UPI00221F45CE|nr:uncharacterized protein EV154DRAFT_516380 [Mucor mucedo]KAI7888852.1 hypothetical protein EV154DRAFT_516380 [Mucor mucedo]